MRPAAWRASALGWTLAAAAALAQPILPPDEVRFPPPLSPQESLATIKVAPGLAVELVAAEPQVQDPIDVAWGADGRMWVVEMADYPSGLDAAGTPGGRVRVLESTRRDGHFDKSTLFASGLRFPMSAVPWRDGVLVAAAPDILFLQDTDGDGRADRSTPLFTSLGLGNQQHMANGLQWGLDGWLYIANGGTRGRIASAKTGESFEMGRDVRIQPDLGLADAQSGRSQFGRNRDDWGNWFGNNNTNPVWHYALEDHYLRRNPQLVPPNPVVTVPEIPGAAPVYPISATLARFNSPKGFNHFTSACSPVIYRDDFLGPGYEGNVFVSEPVHNLVHREVVSPRGTTFTSRRAPEEQATEFLASSDNWARFVNTRAGPDGALYVVDMYRLVIEHPQYIPGEWMRRIPDVRAGADRGRIYRVVPRGRPLRPVPDLARARTAELVAALESPSGTLRDLAQQQLVWRGARDAAPALERLARHAARPQTRVQAWCTLDLLGQLSPALLRSALEDPHPGVRRQAVRLTDAFAGRAPELLEALLRLVGDADALVRQQVAYALGGWNEPAAGAALARLTATSEDPFIVAAAWSSAGPHLAEIVARLEPDAGVDRTLVEMAVAPANRAVLARLLAGIGATSTARPTTGRLTALAQVFDSLARHNVSWANLTTTGSGDLKEAARGAAGWIARARELAGAADTSAELRVAAIGLLGREPAAQTADLELLSSLLGRQHPVSVQVAAIAAMRNLGGGEVPGRLLAGWGAHGPQVRGAVLDVLTSRPAWAAALLDRVAADRDLLAQIDTAHRAALTGHRDARVAERAQDLFTARVDANRQGAIDRYEAAMAGLKGDVRRGAEVFQAACSACHRFGGTAGGAIGPDLAGISDRSAAYLLVHVLDPNRVVESRYVLYSAVRQDGRALAGMIADEAGSSLTLVGLDGAAQVVLRSDLKSLESTGRSLMPEGLESAVTPQAMADLVLFLADGATPTRPRGGRKKR